MTGRRTETEKGTGKDTANPHVRKMRGPRVGGRVTVDMAWSRDVLRAINADPSVSHWVKRAIGACARRDPLDALHDAELLCALMKARWEAVAGIPRAEENGRVDGQTNRQAKEPGPGNTRRGGA